MELEGCWPRRMNGSMKCPAIGTKKEVKAGYRESGNRAIASISLPFECCRILFYVKFDLKTMVNERK
jgi:hypothetical protein